VRKGRFTTPQSFNWVWLILCWFTWTVYSPELSANSRTKSSFSVRQILLHSKSFDLHLGWPASPTQLVQPVLVVYASGDGGWFGAAVDMFKAITQFGYSTAGFSSRSYMKDLSFGDSPITLDDLVGDYRIILDEARRGLALPTGTRVILTGWSRGAAFAMLAGSDEQIRPAVTGVVAIGLPHKEELDIRRRGRMIFLGNFRPTPLHLLFDTYDRVSALAPLPCALIQSTHDDFLPATAAQLLFGPDSAVKRFYAVAARNHRFSGGKEEFQRDLQEALAWICQFPDSPPSGQLAVTPGKE
jgi:hypothetical protein